MRWNFFSSRPYFYTPLTAKHMINAYLSKNNNKEYGSIYFVKYLWNILYYIVSNNFYIIFLTVVYISATPQSCFLRRVYSGKEEEKTTRATLRVKKEIIAEHENGVCVSDLASKYGMPKLTISTSLTKEEMIKVANVAKKI